MANWTATRPLVESPPTSINWSLRGRAVASAGTAASPWRWQGDLDLAPGAPPLYAVGARLYAPSAGAFTQADSVAGSARDPLSLNPFLYAEDSPATLVDPTGHYAASGFCGPDGIYCGGLPGDPAPGRQARSQAARSGARRPQAASTTSTGGPLAAGATAARRDDWWADEPSGPAVPAGSPALVLPAGQAVSAADDARETKALASVSASFTGYGCATVRCQMRSECLASGPENAGYCSSYDWSQQRGLDRPAEDATPDLRVPLVMAAAPVVGTLGAVCVAACPEAMLGLLGLGGASEPFVQQAVQEAQGEGQPAADNAGKVVVDSTAIIDSLSKGASETIDKALAGRAPVAPEMAVNEYLAGPGATRQAVTDWVSLRDGSVIADGSRSAVQNLQSMVSDLNATLPASQQRVLHAADACTAAAACDAGLPLLTRDTRLSSRLQALGLPVEGYSVGGD